MPIRLSGCGSLALSATFVECGAIQVSRERHDHREDVLCPGLFFATRVAELSRSIVEEMSHASHASPAVLHELSRLRRRNAGSSAELYDVCNACTDGHLCHTRAHGNICDAAYHDGNPLALARSVASARSAADEVYSLPPCTLLRRPIEDAIAGAR
jgi:hypothetical protein